MNQSELIANFNKATIPKFNPDLFKRSDDEIIEELKNVILSCQRDKFFTIKVVGFTVVENYSEIQQLLYEYEKAKSKKNKAGKNKLTDNPYDYINLKDSDIKLLLVHYYIAINNQEEYQTIIIAVPRVIEKFYFRLSGSIYSAMHQIVDGSTYNNSNSAAKKPVVTFKTQLAAMRIIRNVTTMKTVDKENIKCVYYACMAFDKSTLAMQYLLAKFGFYGVQHFLGINGWINISDKPSEDNNFYSFMRHNNLYINVPKLLFNNDTLVQSLVYSIYKSTSKNTTPEECYQNEFWLKALASRFNNDTAAKGSSVLDSIEHIYDISTKKNLRLPEDQKKDIFDILKWIMGNFNALKNKDNTDISTKRIRCAEYIAALYAMKLTRAIYHLSDIGKRTELKNVRRAINIKPMYLISEIQRCNLVNYRDMVNDKDSIAALKFTYKGIAGIGETATSAVPNTYRMVNPSHLGRVDLNSSSSTDPGLSGTLCPLGHIYNGGFFTDFQEPNTWEKEFAKTMKAFRELVGLKEINAFSKIIGVNTNIVEETIDESIESMNYVLNKAADSIEE